MPKTIASGCVVDKFKCLKEKKYVVISEIITLGVILIEVGVSENFSKELVPIYVTNAVFCPLTPHSHCSPNLCALSLLHAFPHAISSALSNLSPSVKPLKSCLFVHTSVKCHITLKPLRLFQEI